MRDHERIEELLAVRALGGLEADDAAELERALAEHGPSCETCASLEQAYADVAGELAFALEPVPVREGLEDEVVARALASVTGETQGTALGGGGDVVAPISAAPSRRSSAWRRIALVAAAVVLFVGGWVLRDATVPEEAGGPPAGFLAQATIVPFEGSTGGQLAVAYRPGQPGAYLIGTGVPAPAEGETYELWLIEGDQPTSGGCFVPEDGEVVAEVEGAVDEADLLAVTVEASACPPEPTTTPVLTATPAATVTA
jgi:anti-sigma-K factor RskA